jgi:carbonic anhydrase
MTDRRHPTRRDFMKTLGGAGVALTGLGMTSLPSVGAETLRGGGATPLERLLAGNRRFASGTMRHANTSPARRISLEGEQHPFAGVLSCADSRVPPEIVFDQGLGDIFVVRNAGNVADDVVLGSLEYAVHHLHIGLILVMGHTACGAVTAAVEGNHEGGFLGSIINYIEPAVEQVRHMKGDVINNSVTANARLQAQTLRQRSQIIDHAIAAGKLRVVSARYDLNSGLVHVV